MTPQQNIELFHLIFLRHLGARIDKSFFALKGGCNLRFYFKSIRYSEDIDLDVKTIARETLKTQVTKLLQSAPFQQVLRTRKLELRDLNPAKQTDTTQRWKLKIQGPGASLPIPTKIEFSRRGMKEGFSFEPVDSEIVGAYGLYPILCNHYTRDSALIQKVSALLDRTETQARDIFDIHLLLEGGARLGSLPAELGSRLGEAQENVVSLAFPDYRSQVVAYLSPEFQAYYGTESKWTEMQERLLRAFAALREGSRHEAD